MKFKAILLICTFFLTSGLLKAQVVSEFEKGKIIPSVVCLDDKEQSYALYLPSNYDVSKKWPIIIGFSNAARGIDPVTLCSEAAEKFGFIAIGSNNTRNGSTEVIMKAYHAIKKEMEKRFSIDPQRVYSIGLSGGSGVALQLAIIEPDLFRGIIACAAFVQPNFNYKDKNIFIYGIVGDKDFNYPEFKNGGSLLEKTKTPYWVEVFQGNHEWPPKKQIFEAIEMFDYLHQKKGEDKGKIQADKIIKTRMAHLEQLMRDKSWEHASFAVDNLLRNFEDSTYIDRLNITRKKIDANLKSLESKNK